MIWDIFQLNLSFHQFRSVWFFFFPADWLRSYWGSASLPNTEADVKHQRLCGQGCWGQAGWDFSPHPCSTHTWIPAIWSLDLNQELLEASLCVCVCLPVGLCLCSTSISFSIHTHTYVVTPRSAPLYLSSSSTSLMWSGHQEEAVHHSVPHPSSKSPLIFLKGRTSDSRK